MGTVKRVQVTTDSQGSPAVNTPDVEIWSTKGDQVEWAGTGPFIIDFGGNTPFSASIFTNMSASSAVLVSGPIKTGATGPYKYSVKIGSKVLDPRIIIQP